MNWQPARTAKGGEVDVLVWVEPVAPPLKMLGGHFDIARLWGADTATVWISSSGGAFEQDGWIVTHWAEVTPP